MDKTQDVLASLEGITNLQEAMAMQKSLEELLVKVAPLGKMVKNLPPHPITQLQISDKFDKIDQHLHEFDLVVGDGLVMLPQLPAPVKTGIQKRNVTTPNTTVQKSRVKLYVGGLRPNHTEGQLRRHFAQYGTVTDFHIVRDPKTDESKCFGFVTFQEETHATRALADCPHFIEGGPVYVKASIIKTKAEKEKMAVSSAAIDMNEKLEGTDEGSGIGGGQEVDKLRLFVGSLSPSTTQQALKEHFSHYGNVTRVDVILERESGKPRGIAFVSMSTPQEVEAILEARPHQLSGESIIVRPAYLRPSGYKWTLNYTTYFLLQSPAFSSAFLYILTPL
ncbi:Heterogeneous nuclear ribonucleoprotein A1 [Echinococcus granulosus]|nr:Heterogeneous nuclear ribonucleoprotein A1 [Echinococcus granulosus]